MTTPKEEALALAEWRAKWWDELDATLKVLITIRDTAQIDRDRLEAAKGIVRLLGGGSTRPGDQAKPRGDPGPRSKKPAMDPAEAKEVESILRLKRYRGPDAAD